MRRVLSAIFGRIWENEAHSGLPGMVEEDPTMVHTLPPTMLGRHLPAVHSPPAQPAHGHHFIVRCDDVRFVRDINGARLPALKERSPRPENKALFPAETAIIW